MIALFKDMIKSSFLFGFILTFAFSSLAQTVDDLNKKEMKELILKISLSNDSLKKVNIDLNNQFKDLLETSIESESKNKRLAEDNQRLTEQVDAFKKTQENLNNTVKSNQKTIKQLQDSLNDFFVKRDLSNGQFSTEEIEYITKSLRVQIKKYQNDNEASFVIQKGESTLVKLGTGELGYVPAYEFKHTFNPNIAGDLNGDGQQEVLFIMEVTTGGTYAWQEIFCLKFLPNGQYSLVQVNYDCPCASNYNCGENPFPEFVNYSNGRVYIHMACYAENDASCCPSAETNNAFLFQKDKLVLVR